MAQDKKPVKKLALTKLTVKQVKVKTTLQAGRCGGTEYSSLPTGC